MDLYSFFSRPGKRTLTALALAVFSSIGLCSCMADSASGFAWTGSSGEKLQFHQSASFPAGAEGVYTGSRRNNRYILGKALGAGAGRSLRITVDCLVPGSIVQLMLSSRSGGGDAWSSGQFLLGDGITNLILPLAADRRLSSLELILQPEPGSTRPASDQIFSIRGVAVIPAFRGFLRTSDGEVSVSSGFKYENLSSSSVITIEDPFDSAAAMTAPNKAASDNGENLSGKKSPESESQSSCPTLVIRYGPGSDGEVIKIKSDSATKSLRTRQTGALVYLPSPLFGVQPKSLELILPKNLGIQAVYASPLDPSECEAADLGRILASSPSVLESGELTDYNLFRWDIVPDVLVFDFRDYATQDRYLKRLAFYVEKRGFAGKLARDMEIAGLHGWNAHDYRPEDLASFFSLAAKTDFPLNPEEKRLESVLVQKQVIREKGKGQFEAGRGALISVSRESEAYLRSTFITHESTHALFFADKEYRDFVTDAWSSVSSEERWFWKLYFGWMNYNTASDYLMANEFQAYLLQQPVYRVKEYFQKTLTARLVERHPELKLPIENYMLKYGDSFASHASRLEAWVKAKYGITAGRAYFFY